MIFISGRDKKYPSLGWLATNQGQGCHKAVVGKILPFHPTNTTLLESLVAAT